MNEKEMQSTRSKLVNTKLEAAKLKPNKVFFRENSTQSYLESSSDYVKAVQQISCIAILVYFFYQRYFGLGLTAMRIDVNN